MAVVTNVQFPAQPTVGHYVMTPLGGDGFEHPHSFATFNVDSASDASGGVNQIQLQMDRTYASIVAYITIQVNAMTAASPLLVQVLGGRVTPSGENIEMQRFVSTITPLSVGGTNRSGGIFCPAPQIMVPLEDIPQRPRISAEIDNVNGETLRVNGIIYQYDLKAKFTVPLTKIFGGSLFNSATWVEG